MKNLVIFSEIVCLMVAALYSYISDNITIVAIFAGFDFAFFIGVVIISKITEEPKENLDAYHSAHSL